MLQVLKHTERRARSFPLLADARRLVLRDRAPRRADGSGRRQRPGSAHPPRPAAAPRRIALRDCAAGGDWRRTAMPRAAALQELVILADGLAVFARLATSITAYMRSLGRLRRAAQHSLRSRHSVAASDRLLRARLREIEGAKAYGNASRELFGALLGRRFGSFMSVANRRFKRHRTGRERRNGSGM